MLEICNFSLTTESKRQKFMYLRTHTYTCTHTVTGAYIHNIQYTLIYSLIHSFTGSVVSRTLVISLKLCWRLFFSFKLETRWVLKVTSQTLMSHYVYRSIKREKEKKILSKWNKKSSENFKEFSTHKSMHFTLLLISYNKSYNSIRSILRYE